MQEYANGYASAGLFGTPQDVQEWTEQDGYHKPTESEAEGLLWSIFYFLRTTGKTGKRVLSRATLLKGITAEHKPDPALAARLLLNQLLRDSEASSAAHAAKLREQAEQRRVAEKAARVQVDPIDAMFAKFRKELNNA